MIKEEIKNNLSNLLSESTSYGFPRIFKSKRFVLKIFWLFYFIIGSIATVLFLMNTVMNYLDYEIVSRIQTVSEQSMPFPAITICSTEYNKSLINNKQLDQILETCKFNQEDCKKNANNYFQKVSFKNGDCIQFNNGRNMTEHSIPIRKQSLAAALRGLVISFGNISTFYYIHEPFSLYFINGSEFGNWTNYGLNRYLITKENNQTHRFALSKTVEKKFSTPNNPCYKDVNDFPLNKTIIDFIQSKNITYKQIYCNELCGKLHYIDSKPCGNTNDSLEKFNIDDFNCYLKYQEYFKNQSLEQKCQKYCPLECDSTYYSAMIFENSFFSAPETQIYFDEFKYTLITETGKTTVIELVSNIGGMLSLFIGLSFVSLFEIIEIIIEFIFMLYQKKKKVEKYAENPKETKYFNDLLKRLTELEDEFKKYNSKHIHQSNDISPVINL